MSGGREKPDQALSAGRLQFLAEQAWPTSNSTNSPVRVSLQRPPAGHRVVESYVVFAGSRAARWLVPEGPRAVTLASLLAYRKMQSPRQHALRTALAAGWRVGVASRLLRQRLVVSIDERVPSRDHGDWLILSHLARELGAQRLFAFLEVRRPNPNAKPMLQLFDHAGSPMAYAKIGWSLATREMVRTEAAALRALSGRLQRLVAPELLFGGRWNDLELTVASPLPQGLRRWTTPPEQAPEFTLEVAAVDGALIRGRLEDSSYLQALRAHLATCAAGAPEATRVLGGWIEHLTDHPDEISYGRWHGDWVRWNLGSCEVAGSGNRLAAWDWEHSAAGVPVGFDLLHWHFQQTLPARGLAQAIRAVQQASGQLGRLGVSPREHSLVTALYLAEMFVRVARLSVGGGWNPRFYPAMLDVAHDWQTAQRDRGT